MDSGPNGLEDGMSGGKSRWLQDGLLAVLCVLVVGVYAYTARSGYLITSSLEPAEACYNLLVQGFRAGQLNLEKQAPPGFAQLADPYDPEAHSPYGMLDISYYKGKLYVYFGVTPVLVLFWPYVALTGHYLLQRDAAVIFCIIGFLTSAGLLRAIWRRYFADVSVGVVGAGVLALGLATCTPLVLARCEVYEVSITCGYAFTALALAAVWKALHESRTRSGWLAAASLAYGLAVGARPSLAPGALILLVPVAHAWRSQRKMILPLIAAILPIALVGSGLMVYNALRFDHPFEFGWRYQLAGDRQSTVQPFGLRYLWFNFRVYFLEPARWSGRFPFVHDICVPPLPTGHGHVEHPFGVLTNVPLVWLALAAPLAWRDRSAEARSVLRSFLGLLAVLFGIVVIVLCLFFAACGRYELEFLAPLMLLAVLGVLGLERVCAGRPNFRRGARWCVGVLAGFSVVFNLLASATRRAEACYDLGSVLTRAGKLPEAIAQFEQALHIKPDYVDAHNNLASALKNQGNLSEAIAHYEQALRLKPDSAVAHYNLGLALSQSGRITEAINQWEQALEFKPDLPEAHNNLGSALAGLGRAPEAIAHYEQALRLRPEFAEAHCNLGFVLVSQGRLAEAATHFEQAVRIRPDYVDAHNGLGNALVQLNRLTEAVAQYEQAVRLKPGFAVAHSNLGIALMRLGKVSEAIACYEQALRINPDFAEVHNNLALALMKTGNPQEAIEHWQQTLRIRPELAEVHYNLAMALEATGRTPEAIGHYEQALRLKPDFTEAQNRLARLRPAR